MRFGFECLLSARVTGVCVRCTTGIGSQILGRGPLFQRRRQSSGRKLSFISESWYITLCPDDRGWSTG